MKEFNAALREKLFFKLLFEKLLVGANILESEYCRNKLKTIKKLRRFWLKYVSSKPKNK